MWVHRAAGNSRLAVPHEQKQGAGRNHQACQVRRNGTYIIHVLRRMMTWRSPAASVPSQTGNNEVASVAPTGTIMVSALLFVCWLRWVYWHRHVRRTVCSTRPLRQLQGASFEKHKSEYHLPGRESEPFVYWQWRFVDFDVLFLEPTRGRVFTVFTQNK